MMQIKRKANTPRFVPDYMAKSVADIDFEQLKKRGVRFVVFDADSTLVAAWGRTLLTSTRSLLRQKLTLFQGSCIASNRITNDLQPLADSIDASVVRATIFTRKPSKRFFRRVFKQLGSPRPQDTVMIGDKLIADMWGGKRSGMITVWVERIGNDNPLDRLLGVRRFERWLMRAYEPGRRGR